MFLPALLLGAAMLAVARLSAGGWAPLLPVVLVATGTAAGELFYGFVLFLLNQLGVSAFYLVKTSLLSAAYNAVLTPIFYPVLRRAAEASRARRVTRW